jgi:hypothetical protein
LLPLGQSAYEILGHEKINIKNRNGNLLVLQIVKDQTNITE